MELTDPMRTVLRACRAGVTWPGSGTMTSSSKADTLTKRYHCLLALPVDARSAARALPVGVAAVDALAADADLARAIAARVAIPISRAGRPAAAVRPGVRRARPRVVGGRRAGVIA